MYLDFSHTVSLIIGGSSGIGFQVAKDISECGGRLIIVSKNKVKLVTASRDIKNCDYIAADISKYRHCVRLCNEILHSFRKLDFLVFSAGAFDLTPSEITTDTT
jgi:uncharacterized oxidoreductase